jgi:hypothetical protein
MAAQDIGTLIMTTSGISTFNTTRNEIIRQAALMIKAVPAGGTMNATMVKDFDHQLNAMVKRWQTKGIHVWTTSEATLFPQVGQVKYAIGTGATDHVTSLHYETSMSADEALGQTILSLSSTTNITVGDNIGIVLDDGSLFWTTVSAKDATTVTVASALTDSVAEGSSVFTYTSKISQPLKIVAARRYSIDRATDTPLEPVARRDYHNLPVKLQSGMMNQFFYDRQLTLGYLYLWQVPSTTTELVKFTWHRSIQDFTAAGDNPDLPAEWIQALEYNLAVMMAPQFDVPNDKLATLASMAASFLEDMSGFDQEPESLYIQPDMDGYY